MRNGSLSTWGGKHTPEKSTEDRELGEKPCAPQLCPIPHFRARKYPWRVIGVIGKMYSYGLSGVRLQLGVLFQPDAHKALEISRSYVPGRAHGPGG